MRDAVSRFGQGLRRLPRAVVALFCVAVPGALGASTAVTLAPDDLLGGTARTFVGMTRYEAGRIDGRAAVRAVCDGSASGLIVRRRIDLRATPIIEWSWGVAMAFDGAVDESSRAGDDFPVRLSLIVDGGLNPLDSRAVSYVWASTKPVGADWPNPYVPQARVVAVQSGAPKGAMPWVVQRRNLREDFRRYFGREVDSIDAVAIMTDCDDRATRTEAWYGSVRFLPEDG